MVAALLHLDEGAGAAVEAVDERRRRLARAPRSVADRDARRQRRHSSPADSFSRLPST